MKPPQPTMQQEREANANDIDSPPVPVPTKRHHRASCFFKSALLILRRGGRGRGGGGGGGSKKTTSKDSTTTSNVPSQDQWKNVVDAIRPLHHHQQQQQPHSPLSSSCPVTNHAPLVASPSSSWTSALQSSSSKSNDTMSQYASSQNLQDLDTTSEPHTCKVVVEDQEEDYDENDDYPIGPADDTIDAKADQFIANFYQQMRIQQLKDEKRYNKKLQKLSP